MNSLIQFIVKCYEYYDSDSIHFLKLTDYKSTHTDFFTALIAFIIITIHSIHLLTIHLPLHAFRCFYALSLLWITTILTTLSLATPIIFLISSPPFSYLLSFFHYFSSSNLSYSSHQHNSTLYFSPFFYFYSLYFIQKSSNTVS